MLMVGGIIMVVVLLVFPVVVLMSAAFGAAIIGHLMKKDAEVRHEGSELIELNR